MFTEFALESRRYRYRNNPFSSRAASRNVTSKHQCSDSLPETSSKAITLADFGYSDADGDALASITIQSLPTTGTLAWDGYYPVNAGETIDAYTLDYGNLIYTPDPTAPASYSDSIMFTASDGAATSSPATLTLNVTVTPNTPPVATGSTHSLSASATKTISLTDLGYSDADGDALNHVTIQSLPATGTLARDGYYPVSVGETIDAYTLDYGNLVLTPFLD